MPVSTRAALFICFSALPGFHPAQAAISCDPKFDQDNNDYVDVGFELEICVLHNKSSLHKKYDRNLNGRIDPDELARFETDTRESDDFQLALVDETDLLDGATGLPVTATTGGRKPERADNDDSRFTVEQGIILRKAYEAAGLIRLPESNLGKVPGAQFSFTHDFATGNDVFTGAGAVTYYRQWRLDNPPENYPFINSAAFSAGVEFNRKNDTQNPSRDIDSLTLKMGSGLGIAGQHMDHYFNAEIFDATDFDFSKHAIGGALEYEPTNNYLGIGVAPKLGSLPVYYRFRPTLRAEYQHVLDAGESPQLAMADDYLFVGPVLNAEFWFDGFLERFYVDTSYWYMEDILNKGTSFDYFDIGANIDLDENGHVALSAKFRTGNLPKTRQPVEDIVVGITGKF